MMALTQCPCGGSNEMCGCQNKPYSDPHNEIARLKAENTRLRNAAQLGLDMALANDLPNTAETIRESLSPSDKPATQIVVEAAKALRNAQRAYMDDRGNDELGRAVVFAAEVLDCALAAQKGE